MLVEQLMKKDVITLLPNQTITDARMLMRANKIRHLPIVTENSELVGIVTDRDLKKILPLTISQSENKNINDTPITEVMVSNPITGHPMDIVEEVAVIFYENKIGSLPIVSQDKLVGIITETDLLYKYIELTGAHQPGSQIEIRVDNAPGILFEITNIFNEDKINILSVLIYPDYKYKDKKILAIRIKTMNPLPIIEKLNEAGFEVLWPNIPGMD